MRVWNISYGQNGYSLVLEDVKPWAMALERGFERLCDLTGGRAGGHGLGDWAWKVPLGRPKYDLSDPDEPWLENSLASALMDLENWTFNFGFKHGTERFLWKKDERIWLTHERAVAIDPSFVDTCDHLGDDDEDADNGTTTSL